MIFMKIMLIIFPIKETEKRAKELQGSKSTPQTTVSDIYLMLLNYHNQMCHRVLKRSPLSDLALAKFIP